MSLNEQKNSDKKIIICGGGLVGCLTACYFAKRNYNVELYEYREDIRNMQTVAGRSINMTISMRGRDGLKGIGCEDLITSKGIEMHSRMLHDLNGCMSQVKYGKNGQSILSIDRRHMNEVLLSEAEKYKNVKIFFNHKLQKCNTNSGEALFFDSNSKKEVNVSADLIVGCDGAYSITRQSLLKDKPINFSQTYINCHYLELRMPPTENNDYAMPTNYLHIWPRGEFMLIAMPNQNKSFTCTLFMPPEMFDCIKNETDLMIFFRKNFPDSIPLFGERNLIEIFFAVKPSPLISLKCDPHHGKKLILLGDAAHSMVPFYGQGMNCGFEDCIFFFELLDNYGFENIDKILNMYSAQRVPDAHAICDLAMYNFIEMRYLVTTTTYKIRKQLDNLLNTILPRTWIPLYTMVAFTRMRYSEAVQKRERQNKILQNSMYLLGGALVGSILLKSNLAVNLF